MSRLRAEEFGDLIFLDHGSAKIGDKTIVFLFVLDRATSHLLRSWVGKDWREGYSTPRFLVHMRGASARTLFRRTSYVGEDLGEVQAATHGKTFRAICRASLTTTKKSMALPLPVGVQARRRFVARCSDARAHSVKPASLLEHLSCQTEIAANNEGQSVPPARPVLTL